MTEFQENTDGQAERLKDGQKDGQTLFYRTLAATAAVLKSNSHLHNFISALTSNISMPPK